MAEMMDARAALRNGDARLAMDLLKAEVRKAPRDPRLRTFLFQLFCVTGEWDRALTQLAVAGQLDRAAEAMVQTYRTLIRCEILREKIFAGRRSPTVLGEPGEWVPLLIEATRLLAHGETVRATELRDAAFEAAPETAVTIDGTEGSWIADADPRLGPVAEVIIEGRYVWVPYTRIRCIALEPPQDLRDQVWMPARFTWSNQGTAVGFMPTRYPDTAACSDAALLLAHRTEWIDRGGWSIPVGQRMLVTDTQEAALMDIRRIELTPEQAGAASAA